MTANAIILPHSLTPGQDSPRKVSSSNQNLNLFQVTIDNHPAGQPTDPKNAYFWQRVLKGSFVVSQVKVRVGMKWGEN